MIYHNLKFLLLSGLLFATCLLLFAFCNESKKNKGITEYPNALSADSIPDFPRKDTILKIVSSDKREVEVAIRYCSEKNRKGTILALPGWNYPYSHWIDSTDLCAMALEHGYDLILPSIGKSIYSKRIYPETRIDWKEELTMDWFENEFFTVLKDSFNLLTNQQHNFIIGLSTGARGGLIMALDFPEKYEAVAILSGDYDQDKFPDDNLYKGFFGTKDKFPLRYSEDENPISKLDRLKAGVYIGHGAMDRIVAPDHSEHLYRLLKESGSTNVKFHLDSKAAHDYTYWNSELESIFEFFESQ